MFGFVADAIDPLWVSHKPEAPGPVTGRNFDRMVPLLVTISTGSENWKLGKQMSQNFLPLLLCNPILFPLLPFATISPKCPHYYRDAATTALNSFGLHRIAVGQSSQTRSGVVSNLRLRVRAVL